MECCLNTTSVRQTQTGVHRRKKTGVGTLLFPKAEHGEEHIFGVAHHHQVLATLVSARKSIDPRLHS
jgi:hypothetical protein